MIILRIVVTKAPRCCSWVLRLHTTRAKSNEFIFTLQILLFSAKNEKKQKSQEIQVTARGTDSICDESQVFCGFVLGFFLIFILHVVLRWSFIYLAFGNWGHSKIFAKEKNG